MFNHETHKLEFVISGKLSLAEYDKLVVNLVSFLVWLAEPTAGLRKQLGVSVLIF